MKYELTPAREADKEVIRRLSNRCYREVVEEQFGSWDEEKQLGYFEKKWDPAIYDKIICGGQLAGVIAVVPADDHVFLSEIQVDPDFQGQELGTAVVRDVLNDAGRRGLAVRLRVLLKNRAKSLYERLGFAVTGKTETHHLMEWNAHQRPNA